MMPERLMDSQLAGGQAGVAQVSWTPSYVPADGCIRSSSLVFPGPRVKLVNRFTSGGRTFVLRGPFFIEFEFFKDGSMCARHRTLPVSGFGETQEEALEAFAEAFGLQWEHLAIEDPGPLTEGGKRRREAMRTSVERVL